jgi:hypothetical protein
MTTWREKSLAFDESWTSGGFASRLTIFCAVGVGIWALGLFWKWPYAFLMLNHFPRLDDFLKLCADPLARNLNEPIVAYRVTTPLIANILGFGPGASVLIAWVALALSYATCWVALRRHTGGLFALVIVFTLSQSFYAHTSIRWLGIPDSVTLLALACCLVTKNPAVVSIATVCGMMNDERFLMAAPSLLVWWVAVPRLREEQSEKHPKSTPLLQLCLNAWPIAAGLILGLVGTFALRHALTVGWIGEGIQRPAIYDSMAEQPLLASGWQPYGSTWPLFLFNIAFSWSWMWVYAGYLIFRGLPTVNLLLSVATAAYLLGVILSTSLVIDVSRSMGFIFPLFLAGALMLYATDKQKSVKIAVGLAILMAITPGIYYGAYGSGAVFIPYPVDWGNTMFTEVTGTDFLGSIKKLLAFK